MAKIKITKPDENEQPNPASDSTNGATGAGAPPLEGDKGGADGQTDQDKDEGHPKAAVRTATVRARGRLPVTVEYPADATDPFTAAVNAFKESQGIWSLPEQPEVQQHE